MTVPDIPYDDMLVISDGTAVDDRHQEDLRGEAHTARTAHEPVEVRLEPEAEYMRHYRAQLEQLRSLRAQAKTCADLEGLQRMDLLTAVERDLVEAALRSLRDVGAGEGALAEYAVAERLINDLHRCCSQRRQQGDVERYREERRADQRYFVALAIIVYAAVMGVPTGLGILFGDLSWWWVLLLAPVILAVAVGEALMRRWEGAHPIPDPTPAQLELFLDHERRGTTLSSRTRG